MRNRFKLGWTRGKMEAERMTMRLDAIRVEGRREEENRLRWEDRAKRDLVEMRGDWRTRARDRGYWGRVMETAVKRDQ